MPENATQRLRLTSDASSEKLKTFSSFRDSVLFFTVTEAIKFSTGREVTCCFSPQVSQNVNQTIKQNVNQTNKSLLPLDQKLPLTYSLINNKMDTATRSSCCSLLAKMS